MMLGLLTPTGMTISVHVLGSTGTNQRPIAPGKFADVAKRAKTLSGAGPSWRMEKLNSLMPLEIQFPVNASPRLEMTVGTGIPGDLDKNGIVNVTDLLILLGQFGPCPDPCPPSCEADIDDDCLVGVIDLLIMLGNWTT